VKNEDIMPAEGSVICKKSYIGGKSEKENIVGC